MIQHNKFRKLLIISFVMLFTGCNKETYLESIGHSIIEPNEEKEKVSYYLFTLSNKGDCGNMQVFIDDKPVGVLSKVTDEYISCTTKPEEGKILRVVVKPGSHKIKVLPQKGCEERIAEHYIAEKECMWYFIE